MTRAPVRTASVNALADDLANVVTGLMRKSRTLHDSEEV
jgi:hypothetical protein